MLTTSLAVRIAVDGSALTCVISESECSSVTIYCEGEEVEWLNPNNVVINYTTTERIYSKNIKLSDSFLHITYM